MFRIKSVGIDKNFIFYDHFFYFVYSVVWNGTKVLKIWANKNIKIGWNLVDKKVIGNKVQQIQLEYLRFELSTYGRIYYFYLCFD